MNQVNNHLLNRLLANEATWAADQVERDRNPGPLEPLYFTDPADVPTDLPAMWLLPTICPNQAAANPSEDAPILGKIS